MRGDVVGGGGGVRKKTWWLPNFNGAVVRFKGDEKKGRFSRSDDGFFRSRPDGADAGQEASAH